MGDLPILDAAGRARFATRADARTIWDQSGPGRGVLIVRPARPLAPLEQLGVTLEIPGLPDLSVRGEVVHLEPERAMLRLLDGPVPPPASLNVDDAPAATTPLAERPADFAPTPRPGVPAHDAAPPTPPRPPAAPAHDAAPPTPPHAPAPPALDERRARDLASAPPLAPCITAAPTSAASTKAQSSPSATIAPALTATARIDMGVRQPAVASHLPPYFTGDTVRFASLSDLRGARGEMQAVGAVLAVSDARPPAGAVDVRVAVGDTEARERVRCTISLAQPGTVVVAATDKARWLSVLDELDPPAGARPDSRSLARPVTLPRAGHLWNATTPAQILNLAVHRPVNDADLQRPSVPLLLRWLRTTRGVQRVQLTAAGHPVHTLVIVDGREVRAPVSLPTLGRALAAAEYDYEVTELPRAPNLSHSGRTLHLIADVIRGLLAHHDPSAIAAAFPHAKDTRLVRAVSTVADALGLQGAHARFVKSGLGGDDTVEGVTASAVGARVAWDVLVLLELFGGLSFAVGERRDSPSRPFAGVGAPPTQTNTILEKDLFGVLGLHWSSSPEEIAPAYQKAKRDYAGPKRPADPVLADKTLARIEEAWRTLREPSTRQAYRRATFNLVWPHQAQLLIAQAKLALYRKDLAEARNLLLAAEDIAPSREAAELLRALSKASGD